MKIFVTIIFSLFISLIFAQAERIYSIDTKGDFRRFSLTFSDEFNSNTLDRNKWLTSYPWGQNYAGTCYQEWMTDGDNFVFENGILKMVLKEEKVTARGVNYEADTFKLQDRKDNLREWKYTSGMLFSKEQFRKGIFEIRFKLPTGAGFWPAFWLFGGNPNEEFDIFEAKGEKLNKIHYDMHCPDGGCKGFGNWLSVNGDFSKGFNTMSGEWNENSAFWFLNGQRIASWAGTLNYPASLIANLGLANNYGCAFGPGEDQSTIFPGTFELDYIRIYQEMDKQVPIMFHKNGRTVYTYEHGSLKTKKTGSEIGKTKRALKKANQPETAGHVRLYKDEVGNHLIVQCDLTAFSKKMSLQLKDENGKIWKEVAAEGIPFYKINVQDLPSGSYILSLIYDGKLIQETIIIG